MSFFNFDPNKKDIFQIENSNEPIKNKYNKNNKLDFSLTKNIEVLKDLLHFPDSNDLIFRLFDITINNEKYNALLLFYDGLSDSDMINNSLLRQLMRGIKVENSAPHSIIKSKNILNLKDILLGSLLTENQVSFANTYSKVIDAILHGSSAIIIDTLDISFVCDTKNIPMRSVNKAENEMTIKGPSEAFVEGFRTDTALIRKYVKDENLIFETIEIGTHSKTKCAIAYITNITNDSLIEEVKRRLEGIDIDYLLDAGQVEQLIEDKTFIVEPLILSTERPDKVASNLTEGRVAIIVEGSPEVLIVPALYSDFLRSSEDSYIRYPYTLLLRFFRIPAVIFSVLLPGLYIAITTFHQEMIPTDLLFSIAGTREKVPFSMLIELLIMEVAFEIIREASIRAPAPVGPTLGIVGTLILGQAIVTANIVSPILVIIVALTGISTFDVPNFALNYSYRILRFIYIFLGSWSGFLGIAIGLFINMCLLSTAISFGVPYLTPYAPLRNSVVADDFFALPIWKQENRPSFLKVKEKKKEPKISMKWKSKNKGW